MLRSVFAFFLIFAIALSANAQLSLNDVTLPAKLTFHEKPLVLNGGGIRTKLVFKLYTIGLYLPKKSNDGASILKANETMAVRFQITSSMINSDNMSEAINEGFDKSTNSNTSPVRVRIDKMLNTFSSEAINIGDLFEIVYIPGKGTEIYKNGKLKSTIEGIDFKQALFGIWISDNSISSGLKNDLLDK
jgi:hypothetical protein